MSDIGFPIKDLARRRFQTILTMAGLVLCTATTVFLVTFGDSLGFQVSIVTGGKLTPGFSYILSIFIIIIAFLNFLAGVLITSFLVSTAMHERMRDIGIMKATGCSANSAFSYFLTELSIIVFSSCAFGAFLGIFVRFICISILNALGFSIAQKPVNPWIILLIFASFAIASHILGIRPIRKAIKVKPAEALSPLFQFGTTSPKAPSSSRLGLTFKLAYRSLMRRKSATIQAVICLSVVLALTTVTIAGGMVANQTTQSYVERAIGRDVILVGHPEITRQYVNFLSQFFNQTPMEQINYLSPEYRIPENLISELNSTLGVHVDPRFILEANVTEIPGIIINPEEPDQPYTIIGDNRRSEALIIGVNPEEVVNEWLIVGRVLSSNDTHSAVIGDSLAYENFDSPMNQSALILGNKTEIVGVCLDPLNKGYVVYMPVRALSEQPNYNLLLLEVESSNRPEIIAEIKEEVSGTELELIELNGVLDKHLAFLNRIWSLVMILPLSSLVTATLCLLSFMMLSITGQQREIGIMRALGAKPKTIMKTIFAQALLIVLASGAIGIAVGLTVTWLFLIPEAVISPATLISVIGWLLLALSLICLTSLYPASRATKKSVAEVISQP
jgi:ABC-type antimicrobial peptide transport system permease subunit